jgi:hypothetical protein
MVWQGFSSDPDGNFKRQRSTKHQVPSTKETSNIKTSNIKKSPKPQTACVRRVIGASG